jgi:5'-nucleotidase
MHRPESKARPGKLLAAAWLLATISTAAADDAVERMATEGVVTWRGANPTAAVIAVDIIGLNDLHGHVGAAGEIADSFEKRRIGGMLGLSGVLAAERLHSRRSVVLVAGDSIGGSPPLSGLLRDEPMMEALNDLADRDCKPMARLPDTAPVAGNPLLRTRCRFLSVVGNHEFDRGTAELERLFYGGAHPAGNVLGRAWTGSRVAWLGGNVVRRADRRPFLPGSALVDLDGVRLGIIGIVTAETPALVPRGRIDDLEFLPEVETINASIARLRESHADAIVLLIHEGLSAPTAPQGLPLGDGEAQGRLASILARIDPGVDAVISGHTHKFTNLLFRGRDGRPITVTQSRVDGTSYSIVQLLIDPAKHEVVEKSGTVRTVWAQGGPGEKPDERIAKLLKKAGAETASIVDRVIGAAGEPITRAMNASGEVALGNLVADAERAAAHADFAFMNPGGLRADIAAGPITYGTLYSVQPFGNTVMRVTMTGSQILRLLEGQWSGPHLERPVLLHVSGLSYLYNPSRPPERRVLAAYDGSGTELRPEQTYSVAINDYLLGGGDQFPVLAELPPGDRVGVDLDVLIDHVAAMHGPLVPHIDGRITRVTRQ